MDGSAMLNILVITFSAIFTSNIVLTLFLGLCPFIAVSRELKTAVGMGGAVIFVLFSTCVLNWMIYHWILVPRELESLRFIVFIVTIAAFVQFVEMILDRYSPTLYQGLGIFLPLITVNCAILGAALFMIIRNYSFLETLGWGLGSGIGWAMAIVAMAGIRSRLANNRIPRGLQGPGITLIIAGFMALAFIGFTGIFQATR
ncbi:MAG: NADH:ubiquinone reductase (Na(+)-transporting) subunit E [Planctomycetes bacterium]|nr:NADH:ubiquinone reductase (Na(+)-transporting) subunit E [Planctomycetota bacterium]